MICNAPACILSLDMGPMVPNRSKCNPLKINHFNFLIFEIGDWERNSKRTGALFSSIMYSERFSDRMAYTAAGSNYRKSMCLLSTVPLMGTTRATTLVVTIAAW